MYICMYVFLTFSDLPLRIASISAPCESVSTGSSGLAWDGCCAIAIMGISSVGMGGGGGGGGGAGPAAGGGAVDGGGGGCNAHMFKLTIRQRICT